MALQPDDEICFCFHVTLRKVETYCRVERPRVASQISQCLSAGTGCGWCRPMLRRVHERICGTHRPAWQPPPADEPYHSPQRDASDQEIDAATYARGRQQYLRDTNAKPPGAS